jgi:hypothetical protein
MLRYSDDNRTDKEKADSRAAAKEAHEDYLANMTPGELEKYNSNSGTGNLVNTAIALNFLRIINKISQPDPEKREWRSVTKNQIQRNQFMSVLTNEEFMRYKQWVQNYNACSCDNHVGMGSVNDIGLKTMILGFLDDIHIAKERGLSNDPPYGFGPGEQPMFADFDESLEKYGR